MLFLKQMRAHGFKSFAEPTILDFTHDMIGVVGPNGSGKSNITDAIRWTLGEQSAKSLRGGSNDDVIFSGAADKVALDQAEVTLIFNNYKDTFSTIDAPVIEVTRKFSKKTRENEFYINGEKVKMRDVQDLALETGLTKSSIAIISQGTISTFAESKPDQRREIFDEAAGVAKYKKRKKETNAKLLRALDNLSRIDDISSEIGRRLPSLERASKKALRYKDVIEELQKYQLSILAKDVKIFKSKIDELKITKNYLEEKVNGLTNEINLSEEEFTQMVQESSSSEKSITELNNKFNELVQRISNLKIKKLQAETRENSDHQNSSQDEIKIKQIKKQFEEARIFLQAEKDKQFKLNIRIDELKDKYDYISNEYSNCYDEIQTIQRNIDRLNIEKDFNERGARNNNFGGPAAGSKVIIEHASTLTGVIGTLLSLVKVKEEYQTAISVVAANSMNSVVMKTNSDVKKAIDFLKRNQAGRATFLPLDTLNPNIIQGPQRTAIEAANGFVGFANDLVQIDKKYQKPLDYALGSIVVVNNYDSATLLAKNTNYKFNIVTLDGERILPHGAIIGGKTKNQNIFSTTKVSTSIEDVEKNLAQFDAKLVERNQNLNNFKIERDKLRDELQDVQSLIRNTQQMQDTLKIRLNELSEDHRVITGSGLSDLDKSNSKESESLKFAKEISKAESERDEVQVQLNLLSSNKNKFADRQIELNEINNEKRKQLNKQKEELAKIKAELGIIQERNITALHTLADSYGLTQEAVLEMEVEEFEDELAVRDRIQELKAEITEIGNVNIESIVEFETEKERYEYYETQAKEIKDAIDKLNSIISDIDIAMETQFKRIIDDVNNALPEAVQKLFGGGTAKLIYTQPDNILETGIDIEVNPPGKKISNLNLLSGGEKSLVALSVLFSILKVRPLPLVVLDEAEAPLDVANVERFAKYVKQFTVDTQFIIVTHREGTMENCDVLFGVTMESKGVTKIVNIKLVDAKQLATAEAE